MSPTPYAGADGVAHTMADVLAASGSPLRDDADAILVLVGRGFRAPEIAPRLTGAIAEARAMRASPLKDRSSR